MGRSRLRRRDRGGGEAIPPLRPHRPRVLIAAGALACAVALAAHAVALADGRRPLAAALGGAAVCVLLAALAGRMRAAIPWAVAGLGAAYAVALVERGGGLDPAAPVCAAALFACAELADWSADAAAVAAWDRAVAGRRLRAIAFASAVGAAGAAVVVVAADVATARAGVATTVLGTVCAVAFAGLLALLARAAGPTRAP